MRLYLKLHYELAALEIPRAKLLCPHSSSIMDNRYVTRAFQSRTVPLGTFLGKWKDTEFQGSLGYEVRSYLRKVPDMVV